MPEASATANVAAAANGARVCVYVYVRVAAPCLHNRIALLLLYLCRLFIHGETIHNQQPTAKAG